MSLAKLQTLTTYWSTYDLPSLQSQLDEVAGEITARQDESDVGRKALIDGMKEFKKDNEDDVRTAVAPLIRSFQNEVDALARRSKAAEKAFFDVYKRLADVADPAPTLAQALEAHKALSKMQDLEIEAAQLRETLTDYNKEIAESRSKEKKLLELQTKVEAYDKNIDATLQERIQGVTERMLAEYNEKLAAVEESRSEAERKAAEQEARVRSLERQLEEARSKMSEVEDSRMERSEAKLEQVEMLLNDLEASNQRAAVAERELEAARERLDSAAEERASAAAANSTVAEEEAAAADREMARELDSKEREVKQLLSDLKELKESTAAEQAATENQIQEMEDENQEAAKRLLKMELKLEMQSDYENVKKELNILKSLEFSQHEGGDGEEQSSQEKKPLEVMILERSKALQSENTNLRVERDRLTDELTVSNKSLANTTRESERQQTLIAELEDHVERLQDLTAGTVSRPEAEGRSSADILVADSLMDLTPRQEEQFFQSPVAEKTSAAAADTSALLPIVHAQRERFRQRNEELEDAQARHLQQISLLQGETEGLKTDNVKLYEKIRFLQGFGGAPRQIQSSSSSAVVEVESRYRNTYEQKLDPFSTFSNQERQRRYGQLNVFEKIILSFVQFAVGNKTARLFVFFYAVLLHALVLAVLWYTASSAAHRRDIAAEWHGKYASHMHESHGETAPPFG